MSTGAGLGLQPPSWAANSIAEDGGVTHERVSELHPRSIRWVEGVGATVRETDVSISVVDRLVDGGWVRTEPTIQVEGGTFPVAEAQQLVEALNEVLARTGAA